MRKGTADRLRVVSGREEAPATPSIEELAMEAALAAVPDFIAAEYPQWAWPWRLARRLRALSGVTADTNAFTFRAAFVEFCRRAEVKEQEGEVELSDLFFDRDQWDDRFAEFLAAWPRILVPEGHGPLELAFLQAQRRPLIPQEAPSLSYVMVMSTAYYLQADRGRDVPFFLPSTRLAPLIQKTAQHASSLKRLLQARSLLVLVDGSYSYTKHIAQTYTFNLDAQGVLYRLSEPRLAP